MLGKARQREHEAWPPLCPQSQKAASAGADADAVGDAQPGFLFPPIQSQIPDPRVSHPHLALASPPQLNLSEEVLTDCQYNIQTHHFIAITVNIYIFEDSLTLRLDKKIKPFMLTESCDLYSTDMHICWLSISTRGLEMRL